MKTQVSEFKGQPILSIMRSDDDRFPFSFGVAKAEMILANLPAIQAFVKRHKTVVAAEAKPKAKTRRAA